MHGKDGINRKDGIHREDGVHRKDVIYGKDAIHRKDDIHREYDYVTYTKLIRCYIQRRCPTQMRMTCIDVDAIHKGTGVSYEYSSL